jgi:hypothetical protein
MRELSTIGIIPGEVIAVRRQARQIESAWTHHSSQTSVVVAVCVREVLIGS